MKSSEVLVISDGSFSGNNDGCSQVEHMILISERINNRNITSFSSTKSRSVLRSVLGAETYVMADSCDAFIVIQLVFLKIIMKNLETKILTDCETLFNLVIRH